MTDRAMPGAPATLARRFVVAFLAYTLLFGVAARIDTNVFDGDCHAMVCRTAAWSVASVLRFVAADTTSSDTTIYYNGVGVHIIPECTGIDIIGLFVAAVLAFPAALRRKMNAILIGVFALTTLNIIRMVALVYSQERWPNLFEVSHLYIWPSVLLTIALMGWLRWANGSLRD